MKKPFFVILLTVLLAHTAFASYIGYLCPAGAKRGSTCEFIAGGRDLRKIKALVIDGDPNLDFITVEDVQGVPGGLYYLQKSEQKKYVDECIHAVFKGEPMPPLPEDTVGWKENRYLQNIDKLSILDREMLLRGFYTRPDPLQASPSIAEQSIITLKIAENAPLGLHTIRFIGNDKQPKAINPIPFFIGELPEVREPYSLPPPQKPDTPIVTLPATMNGQILPGETDCFQFNATKGDTWNFHVYGRALLPFIGDGVPGHFQPILQILNQDGHEVAFQDDTFFEPDPRLNFTAPTTGKYTLAIRDALYRGREDFVYRIEAKKGPEDYQLLPGPTWQLPIVQMTDNQNGMRAPFPAVIHGTILPAKPHQLKVNLAKGQEVVFEVWARRSLSPLDAKVRVLDFNGKVVAMNDDFARPKIGQTYHHADSYLRLSVPESGPYTIEISDTCNAGGKEYQYWLRMDVARPDFRIWSIPSGIEVPAEGGVTPVGFVVERVDGHTGDISLMVVDSDELTIAGSNVIPFGDKKANSFESVCGVQAPYPDCTKEFLTLALRQPGKPHMTNLKLVAQSGEVMHPVIPADESMQAFAYNHLIPAKDCCVAVLWNGGQKLAWLSDSPTQQTIHPGEEIELKLKARHVVLEDTVSAELYSPPQGFTLVECTAEAKIVTLKLKADENMKTCQFNQVIRVTYSFETFDKETQTTKKAKASAYLPAILFRIE